MTPHTQPTVGDTLAGYRIDAFVGSGGMGEVYRAFDMRLNRNVALKVLIPRLADDEDFRQRFLHESRLAASLDHPNVIPVYEAGEAEGRLFIAMRFVEGTDLRHLLESEQILAPERSLALLAPVAGALDTAHAKGLVHRDVKPANILIASEPAADPPEHVYLSDFGLTTLSSDPGNGGPFTGTADYAAPEAGHRRPGRRPHRRLRARLRPLRDPHRPTTLPCRLRHGRPLRTRQRPATEGGGLSEARPRHRQGARQEAG
jgi:serine/threonine protein kinase